MVLVPMITRSEGCVCAQEQRVGLLSPESSALEFSMGGKPAYTDRKLFSLLDAVVLRIHPLSARPLLMRWLPYRSAAAVVVSTRVYTAPLWRFWRTASFVFYLYLLYLVLFLLCGC